NELVFYALLWCDLTMPKVIEVFRSCAQYLGTYVQCKKSKTMTHYKENMYLNSEIKYNFTELGNLILICNFIGDIADYAKQIIMSAVNRKPAIGFQYIFCFLHAVYGQSIIGYSIIFCARYT